MASTASPFRFSKSKLTTPAQRCIGGPIPAPGLIRLRGYTASPPHLHRISTVPAGVVGGVPGRVVEKYTAMPPPWHAVRRINASWARKGALYYLSIAAVPIDPILI
jgi:hypothetical protein